MGRQPDLQATLQAMEQLRCELAQSQQSNETTKSASTGRNTLVGSGLIVSLLGAGWTYVQDQATQKARDELIEQKQQAQVETLTKRLETTDASLQALLKQIRQQAIDNVALTTHLASKLDAVSARSRRVEKGIAVEAAETRAAQFRIGD